ncbi:hypothetical protein LTR84_004247 [Exophiala bonariae]|uniref:D-xylose reductase [NAD(P)H] n=1 Tax=Exophiala bonariae TaxID=1690606 RepID=A0AAV9N4J0_9EURO|nr:hypothetical protein LTR84_004247 [Exophiala bonariae]
MSTESIKLNTGARIPILGLGTWQSAPGEVKNAVAYALQTGYKHIDCAFCYANEDEVGEGLQEAFEKGIKREDVFVTTKLWSTFSSKVEEGLDLSLKSLGLEYVDLYLASTTSGVSGFGHLMQWTGNDIRFPKKPDGSRDLDLSWSHTQTWKQMEDLLKIGKARAIGVCNYSVRYLNELLQESTIVPAVNQIENHPHLPQNDIVHYCKEKGIHVTAYSPLGSTGSPLARDPCVQALAAKYQVSPSTVLLSYHSARGISVLAKSVTPGRIDQNQLLIPLGEEDLQMLEAIHKTSGVTRYVYPPFGVDFGFPDKAQDLKNSR